MTDPDADAELAWQHAEEAHNDDEAAWPNDSMTVDYLRAIAAELRSARISREGRPHLAEQETA